MGTNLLWPLCKLSVARVFITLYPGRNPRDWIKLPVPSLFGFANFLKALAIPLYKCKLQSSAVVQTKVKAEQDYLKFCIFYPSSLLIFFSLSVAYYEKGITFYPFITHSNSVQNSEEIHFLLFWWQRITTRKKKNHQQHISTLMTHCQLLAILSTCFYLYYTHKNFII